MGTGKFVVRQVCVIRSYVLTNLKHDIFFFYRCIEWLRGVYIGQARINNVGSIVISSSNINVKNIVPCLELPSSSVFHPTQVCI